MFTFGSQTIAAVAGLGLLTVLGCRAERPNPVGAVQPRLLSGGGVRVAAPEGFAVVAREPRLQLREEGDIRSPLDISVWREDDAPALERPKSRMLDGTEAHYLVEEFPGGSGGPAHVLRAFKRVDGSVVQLEAEVQREFGPPSFDVAWAVFASAEFVD